jgi:hypothetical protein
MQPFCILVEYVVRCEKTCEKVGKNTCDNAQKRDAFFVQKVERGILKNFLSKKCNQTGGLLHYIYRGVKMGKCFFF